MKLTFIIATTNYPFFVGNNPSDDGERKVEPLLELIAK